MLSASAVDALWRACLFKLSKLLALDIRLDDASTSSSSPEEDVTTIESPPSDDDDDDENEDENDALSVYLRYLSILRALNLCEHSCVHPQKHRLIDRLMSCVYFRAAKVRLKGESECLFDTETMEERLRHRNETKENGNMVVPTRFWRERRGFLKKEVASVMEKVNADVTASRPSEMDFDAPDDDGRQSDETNGLDEEEELIIESTNAEETNSQEEEDEETRKGEAEEGVGVVAEELNEGEVKEGKSESSLAKYAEDEKHRLAVVNVQRHARGCLARKKMRRKVEDELERLGMLVLNKDDASSTRTKKMKMKMNVCVDSRSRSTARAAGSEEEDKDDDTEEDIETKIELLREKRLREFEQNQPHVYERTKKALLEEHGSKIETFVREYRETHQGALPELKDIPIILDDSNERKKEDKDDEDDDDVTENKTKSDENRNNAEDDRKCGFEALRKILEESERAFPSATTTSSTSNDDDALNTQEINDNRRERRNTSFSEQAEKRAIEREVLKEVSIEIKENVKLALERMRQEEDVNDATLTTKTTRKEEDGNSTKSTTEAAMKNKSSATKKAKKQKQTKKNTKKKSTKCPKSCASALEQEKALFDSIDAYPMAKYLLQHNVKIDCFCSSEREKKYDDDDTVVNNNTFIASGADEFVYCEEEAPDRSVDDQKRAIESIKSNVLIPLGASTSSVWLESYAHNAEKPKHLLFIGPRGCGQKHFAKNVLARETGSVFFDCSIENVTRRRSKEPNATTTEEHDGDDTEDTGQDDESAFCADLLKRTFQLAKKWAPSVVYVGNIENAFATGKKKKTKKKTKKTKTKKGNAKEGNEEEGEEDEDRNVSEENTVGNGTSGTDGTQADASVSSNAKTSTTLQTQKVDPKSFKAGLTAALKSLEKENNSSSRRVCVVASISDASRLTKKDEKSVLGKIFHPKETFAAPFMRPSRAARYDLLKTFYREVVDEYYTEECNNNTTCLSSSKKSTKSKSRMFSKVVADGARDEGAVSELSHFAETCNRKVLKLCVREGFRKAVEYISTKSIVQPRAFTDSQRALVWRFASESLRNLRETNQKRIDEEQDDFYDENENTEAEFFFASENESTLRLFAKRVCCRLRYS